MDDGIHKNWGCFSIPKHLVVYGLAGGSKFSLAHWPLRDWRRDRTSSSVHRSCSGQESGNNNSNC